MGSWSTSIMGGDTPLDYRGNFEDHFGVVDPDHENEIIVPYRVPTAEEAVSFINNTTGIWGGGDDHILKQVTGFLMIERHAPMSDELRRLVIEGIEAEDYDNWSKPEDRRKSLSEFRKIVEAYPSEGAQVALPHQPGLFEMLAR